MPRDLVAKKNTVKYAAVPALLAMLALSPAQASETAGTEPSNSLASAQQVFQNAWDQSPLSFTEKTFAKAPAQGYGDFDPVDAAVFDQNEPIIVYAEPVGYAFREADGAYNINLSVDFELRNMTGQILASQKDFAQLQNSSRKRVHEFQTSLQFGLQGLQEGDYTLMVRINDLNSDKTGSFELPFSMNGPVE
ncbi:hypothetical protein PUV47_15585 [Pseudovibrio exalbescens]|uniref:hypothetical protein n=1 Tax=Pseudovibrio exalbescens TaxID=197461 RepID=UPI00236540B2|nr:hypothetical protein [Pseudovibrio exalbescens]MDD7911352.1 hypothetical protein [Pseudovibrio exalbescens]